MKLFGLFGKKSREKQSGKAETEAGAAREEQGKQAEEIGEQTDAAIQGAYSGMRTEVTDFDGRVLFVAKLMDLHRNTAQIYQYSESMLSPEDSPVRVRIRGFNDNEKKAVHMEGVITPKPEYIWQVNELIVTKLTNERAFFRLNTDLDATLTAFNGIQSEEKTCKLLNISVGGALIGSEDKFRKGNKFMLRVKLLEDRPPSVMLCQVLRVVEKEESQFEYGCQFLGMTEDEQKKITQNIFEAQGQQKYGS